MRVSEAARAAAMDLDDDMHDLARCHIDERRRRLGERIQAAIDAEVNRLLFESRKIKYHEAQAEIAELVEALRQEHAPVTGLHLAPCETCALLSRYQTQENPVSSTNRKKESSK